MGLEEGNPNRGEDTNGASVRYITVRQRVSPVFSHKTARNRPAASKKAIPNDMANCPVRPPAKD
jgi:hypothetical protein